MPPKRIRRASPPPTGLSAGERLKRAKLTGNAAYSAWGWVGTEVTDASAIRDDHRLATCGFSRSSNNPLCANKHLERRKSPAKEANGDPDPAAQAQGASTPEDVIVISDDEGPTCSIRACKYNPYCLNYLGQDRWEDIGEYGSTWLLASE